MLKTITLRLADNTYELFKIAAAREKRSISNFIEWATSFFFGKNIKKLKGEYQNYLNIA